MYPQGRSLINSINLYSGLTVRPCAPLTSPWPYELIFCISPKIEVQLRTLDWNVPSYGVLPNPPNDQIHYENYNFI